MKVIKLYPDRSNLNLGFRSRQNSELNISVGYSEIVIQRCIQQIKVFVNTNTLEMYSNMNTLHYFGIYMYTNMNTPNSVVEYIRIRILNVFGPCLIFIIMFCCKREWLHLVILFVISLEFYFNWWDIRQKQYICVFVNSFLVFTVSLLLFYEKLRIAYNNVSLDRGCSLV